MSKKLNERKCYLLSSLYNNYLPFFFIFLFLNKKLGLCGFPLLNIIHHWILQGLIVSQIVIHN